jgi:hypothetical protein
MMLSTLTLLLSLAAAAPSEEAVRMIKSAEVAMVENRMNDAIVLAEHALQQAPDAWQAHKVAGEALMHLDKTKEALPHLRRWAELRPGDARAAESVSLAEKKIAGSFSVSGPPAGGTSSDKTLTSRAPRTTPLGEVARRNAETADKSPGAGVGASAMPPPLPQDVPAGVLDPMRHRAEKIFRARMVPMATTMKQLRSTTRLYRSTCHKQQLGLAAAEIVTYGSDTAWSQNWVLPPVPADSSAQCRTLATDVKTLLGKVSGGLAGVDRALSAPPPVYPAIREEVFDELVHELW